MKRNLQRAAYRPREAAEVTGLSLRFLYYAIQQKDLPSIRVGSCLVLSAHPVRLADLGFDCPSASWKQVNLFAKQKPWSLMIFDHSRIWQLRSPGVFLQSAPATGACFSRHLWCSASDLAVSVAPLTTLVMGVVDQNRAGAAAGINSAVARIAGPLSIAVLAVAMVTAFSFYFFRTLLNLAIPAGAMHDLRVNEIKLAASAAPAVLDSNTAAAIRVSIERAFIFGFRFIMLICAGRLNLALDEVCKHS